MQDYLNILTRITSFINEFEEGVCNSEYFNKQTRKLKGFCWFYCYCPHYNTWWQPLSDIICLSDMLGIEYLENEKKDLVTDIEYLRNPEATQDFDEFKENLSSIKFIFKNVEDEIIKKISYLDEEEKRRLNEAFNCYVQGLNYSTVVMSVSAIENRLFSLMSKAYNDDKLEEFTLGQLIREYLDNKKTYGNVIPKKHQPLLEYCNTYRILSGHPKRERINRQIATSIICMTCSFLFDKDLKIAEEEKKS